jgi:hypothetical protein
VHNASDVREVEVQKYKKAEPLVPCPSHLEVGIAAEKFQQN